MVYNYNPENISIYSPEYISIVLFTLILIAMTAVYALFIIMMHCLGSTQ